MTQLEMIRALIDLEKKLGVEHVFAPSGDMFGGYWLTIKGYRVSLREDAETGAPIWEVSKPPYVHTNFESDVIEYLK